MHGPFPQHPPRPAVPSAAARAEAVDWDDLRYFLALLQCKSLTEAARTLGVTQSTVGRRLAALENRLGVRLLQRSPEGYTCTAAGEAIREHVERINGEAQRIERMIGGLDLRLDGTVRVAAPVLLANHLLTPVTALLRARYPDIVLDLSCQPTNNALPLRGCHIIVQPQAFDEPDLIVRRIGLLHFGLYASLEYLRRRGHPPIDAGCCGHDLIAPDEAIAVPGEMDWLAATARNARIALRTNCRDTQVWAALQGAGLALLPNFRADCHRTLCRVPARTAPPVAEIWLAVHRDNRDVPRVRAVLDCIAETVRRATGEMEPEPVAHGAPDGSRRAQLADDPAAILV